MGLSQLRRYDVQARYAFTLAIISVVPFGSAGFMVFRNYQRELGQIVYGEGGSFLPAFAGLVLCSMIPSVLGMLLGWSSAGQRRNDKPARSWTGFFLGGFVLTFDVILLIAFWMLRLEQPI